MESSHLVAFLAGLIAGVILLCILAAREGEHGE